MNNELKKFYKLCGYNPECKPEMMKCFHCENYRPTDELSGKCVKIGMPEITPFKILALFNFLASNYTLIFENWQDKGFNLTVSSDYILCSITRDKIDECIISACVFLWDDMREDDKKQIKAIINE